MSRIVIGECKAAANPAEAFRCFDRYREYGGSAFDTARSYGGGKSEAVLGSYLRTRARDSYCLVTKCGHHDFGNPPKSRLSRCEITGDVETSLRELGISYADVLLLHRDDVSRPVEEIMPVLHELVVSGKTADPSD